MEIKLRGIVYDNGNIAGFVILGEQCVGYADRRSAARMAAQAVLGSGALQAALARSGA